VSTNLIQDRPSTSQKSPISYMFGHPLESTRINSKSPRASDESKNN